MEYEDFKITVEHLDNQNYRIRADSDSSGEARQDAVFPFDDAMLSEKLTNISKNLNTIKTRAAGGPPVFSGQSFTELSWDDVEAFGGQLFGFVFAGKVTDIYRAAQTSSELTEKKVRIKLTFEENAAKLAAIPWELLYDALKRDFVTLKHQTSLTRYINLGQSIRPLKVKKPLKILAMISNRDNDLNVEQEKEWLEESLSELINEGQIQLGWVDGDTHKDLQEAIRKDDWHVFHYIGHGGFDDVRQRGYLLFGDDRNPAKSMKIPARSLSRILDAEDFKLVVLNACEGATGSSSNIFSSTASELISGGISAVLAMQYPITDDAAIELAGTFYSAISDGVPVDYALTDARHNISISYPDYLEWATPVLFMRTNDGLLFELDKADQSEGRDTQSSSSASNDPAGYDPQNVKAINHIDLRNVVRGFTLEEIKDMVDELSLQEDDLSYEDLPGSAVGSKARELIGFLDRRNNLPILVDWLNQNGKGQISKVLNHLGPVSYEG